MRFGSEKVICPYYSRDEPRIIECEGPVKDSFTVVRFKHKDAKETYKELYCDTFQYGRCRVARMLDVKNGAKEG